MQLVEPAVIRAADENDIYQALSALNEELRRRIDADDGLATTVRALYPTAVAVLCDVETSSGYPTAEPDGVLLADGTTVPVGKDVGDDTAREAWLVTCDDVANLAAVDGAITSDVEHGWVVRFDTTHRSAVDGVGERTTPVNERGAGTDAGPLDAAKRLTAKTYAAYDTARYDYALALLGEVACRVRAAHKTLRNAVGLRVGPPVWDGEDPSMPLLAVLAAGEVVLADAELADGEAADAFDELAEEISDDLGTIAELGVRPDGNGLLTLPAPAEFP